MGGQDMTNKKQIKTPYVEEKKKIAICMAVGEDNLRAKTMFSLVHALRVADFDYDFFMQISCDIIGNRSRLVQQAIDIGATHMLFLDYDMFFPPDSISKLLELDKDIVGAPYNFRSLPLRPAAAALSDLSPKDVPYRCTTIPTGFMLIKMSVFDKIAKPWFNFGRNEKNELVCGEDSWFCQQAIKAGIEVWAEPRVSVKHVGEFLY